VDKNDLLDLLRLLGLVALPAGVACLVKSPRTGTEDWSDKPSHAGEPRP
jgi:hypothetical protein